MSTKELLTEADAALTTLQQLLFSFDEEQINTVPFEGSWTAGQIGEHMIMANSGFVQVLNGPVKETERAPDALVETIKDQFLNFGVKMQSPAFVVPADAIYRKAYLLQSIEEIRDGICNAIETKDLTKTYTAFEVPVMGYLTGVEAVNFVIYHTQRHIHQLKNVRKALVPAL